MSEKIIRDKKPLISVIMGIYNCEQFLCEAIDSIIAQTYDNWEFIICDDGSTDNSAKVAQEYANRYPEKINLIRHEHNMYLSATLNDCLAIAKGELIARMDGDDISDPKRFEKQVDYLMSNPNIDLVGTAMQRFNDEGISIVLSPPKCPNKQYMRDNPPFNHATIMTYKRVYDTLGGYKVSNMTKRSQDLELWFRFYAAGFIGENMHEALYFVREDINAIKRRTFINRWNVFRIKSKGYKMLKFPISWTILAFFEFLIKSITPTFIVMIYRKNQKKHFQIHE